MPETSVEEQIKKLNNNISKLSKDIERLRLGDFIEELNRPVKLFYSNFIWGLSRGLGMAVGFTVLGAVLLYTLQRMVSLPVIGNYISEIVKIVQNNLR